LFIVIVFNVFLLISQNFPLILFFRHTTCQWSCDIYLDYYYYNYFIIVFIIIIIIFVITIVVIIAIITIWCYAPSVSTCIVRGAVEMTVLLFTINWCLDKGYRNGDHCRPMGIYGLGRTSLFYCLCACIWR